MPRCPPSWIIVAPDSYTLPPGRLELLIFTNAWSVSFSFLIALLFFVTKNSYTRTRIRSMYVTVIIACTTALFGISQTVPFFAGIEGFPCWLSFALALIPFAFLTVALIVRNTWFILLSKLGTMVCMYGRLSLDNVDFVLEEFDAMSSDDVSARDGLGMIWLGFKQIFLPPGSIPQLKDGGSMKEFVRLIRAIRFVISNKGTVMYGALVISPWLLVIVLFIVGIPEFRDGCNGCLPYSPFIGIVLAGEVVVQTIFVLFFNFRVKGLNDAWGFFLESRLTATFSIPAVVVWFLLNFAQPVDSAFSYCILIVLFLSCALVVQIFIPLYMGWRENVKESAKNAVTTGRIGTLECRTSSNSLKSAPGTSRGRRKSIFQSLSSVDLVGIDPGMVDLVGFGDLYKIMADPDLLKEFEAHLAHEFAGENILFLMDTNAFVRDYYDITDGTKNVRARKIVHLYVNNGSLFQVNIPDETAAKLVTMDFSKGIVSQQIFNSSRFEVASMLQNGACARFLDRRRLLERSERAAEDRGQGGRGDVFLV